MFEVGQKVVANGGTGMVTFIEDDLVCVDFGNGVEHEFTAADVQTWTAPEQVVEPRMSRTKLFPAYHSRRGDDKLAAVAMAKIGELYPPLIDAAMHKNDSFDRLAAIEQIKFLSEMTGTPVVIFLGGGEMGGELMREVLRKTVINNLVEGSGLVVDMLMGTAKKALGKLGEE